MKRFISTITSFVLMISMITCIPVNAEESEYITVDISGNYNYEYAFEMLRILNQYRKDAGLSPMVMEKRLLRESMERAAELSVYYDHDRPNGEQGLGGETIAWHQYTPQQVVDAWLNSPKHRYILMRGDNEYGSFEEAHKNYNIGAGCFCDELGRYYWIFGLGIDDDIPVYEKDYDSIIPVTKHIEVLKSRIAETGWTFFVDEQKTDREYRFGETRKIPYCFGTQPYYGEGPLDYSNFTFTSSDPTVVSVNEAEHNLTIGNAGTATITATLKNDTSIYFERNITVKPQELNDFFRLQTYTVYYDGTEQKPVVTNSEGYIEGKDYTVTYENNIGNKDCVTRGTVIITGINNYTGTVTERFTIYNNHCCYYDWRNATYKYNHSYSNEWTIDKAPTCTDPGSKSHHCTVCDTQSDITTIPATGHSYGNGQVTKAPTCTSEGVKTYTCSVCGNKKTESMPKLEHKYKVEIIKEATCSSEGAKTYTCTVCGSQTTDLIPKIAHKYAVEMVKEPTCVDNGIQQTVCTECKKCTTESVSAKGHSYTTTIIKPSYTAQGYTVHTCTVCGDSYNDNYTNKLALDNVSGFKASETSTDTIKLTWDKVSDATGYVVYRAISGKWVRVGLVNTNSFYEGKLKSGTSYRYAVKAYKTVNDNNHYSPSYPTLWTSTKPANISKASFTSGTNAVKMNWSKVSGATGYRVYKYNTSTKKWQAVANITGTSYTFSKLKAGTTYKFTVRAYKTLNGTTYLSPKFTTFATSTNPATVNFTLTSGSKKAVVKWSKVTGATGYKVYYKTSKTGKWVGLKTTNNKTTSYTKTGLTKGKTYYFTVKAYRTVNGKTYNGAFVTKSVKVK